ncbi:MAG: glutamyl-tRNA reductase [Planctomycetota bacterium]
MAAKLDLLLLGLSHRTAAMEVRDRVAMAPAQVSARLEAVASIAGVEEAWIISTCNRTEVLLSLVSADLAEEERVQRIVTELVFPGVPAEAIYAYRRIMAVMHVFRVVSGLDSLVLGESQILAQVKLAFALARKAGTAKKLLLPLLQQALATGKRIRKETRVGDGTLSVARAGVDVASHVFGRFADAAALIVGAGETGKLVARNLAEHRIGRLYFLNRTLRRAAEAALLFGGQAARLDQLADFVPRADVIFACVDGAPNLIGPAIFDRKRLGRRDRPLVLVDLSVPRAVDPAVAALGNVISYDLDDLARVVDTNRNERQRASEEAAPILLAEVHKFVGLRTYASFSPAIARMRERFDQVREQELDAVAGEHATPEMIELAHRLSRHLLDVALDQLKERAKEAIEADAIGRAYQRFLEEQ